MFFAHKTRGLDDSLCVFLLTKNVDFRTRGAFLVIKHFGFMICGMVVLTKHVGFIFYGLWFVDVDKMRF